MSVLIKDMEMPVIELEWTIRRGADGKWYAIDTNAETSDGEWHEIVPVPPHGRLIDETWLNMQIHTAKETHANEKHDFCNAFDSNGHVCTEWWCVEDMIENAPTIIPAEEGDR